ncbi:UFM1 specific ligase 1 [Oratosquilla oratoria]|uniref:UFM1 specific ligase 1 n=1 Tax=Oratosquilla oratoria TaxID=337810 RepID=UPI003F757CB0
MSSADWEEVKRLAADFQRAQLSSTLQRLSERNCVEIINKLVELKLLNVYYTTNGKEYVTPQQLIREIKDELFVHGGRINLVDVSAILGIDLSVVEGRASELSHSEPGLRIVLGQLISRQYLDTVAEEINEKLQQDGTTTIGDIAKAYDLPGDFVLEAVVDRLGTIIHGQQDDYDPRTIFTNAYVARHRARVRGVLSAVTRPIPVSTIISQHGFQERLFFSVVSKLIANGRLPGNLTGGRQANKAVYIPDIHSRTQMEWVDGYLRQNGYLEYESLKRLGITDPEGYIRKRYKDEHLTVVGNVCVGPGLIDQIEAAVDDALLSGGWVDIYPLLPSVFSGEVGCQLVNMALKKRQDKKSSSGAHVFCDTIVVSDHLFVKITSDIEALMPPKAKQAIDRGAFKQQLSASKLRMDDDEGPKSKKEERRKKAAGGKSGGGTQGRETKTRSVKNKHKGRKGAHDSDSDDDDFGASGTGSNPGKLQEIEFLTWEELLQEVTKNPMLVDCPEELTEEIAQRLHQPMTRKFQEVAKSMFLASLAAAGDSRRKNHQQLQEKVSGLLVSIRLSEKGIKAFGSDQQEQLYKHLLKSLCTDMVNELVMFLADDSMIDFASDKALTPEARVKIISKLDDAIKEPMASVHKTLTGASLEDFFSCADSALSAADIMLKKKDHKKDRQMLIHHREGLIEQLQGSMDTALTLHLASLILFHSVTGHMLHASGKFVPQILGYLKDHLPAEIGEILLEYQGNVMKSLKNKDNAELQSEVLGKLETFTPKVKEIAITFKKSSVSATTEE